MADGEKREGSVHKGSIRKISKTHSRRRGRKEKKKKETEESGGKEKKRNRESKRECSNNRGRESEGGDGEQIEMIKREI